MIPEKNFFSFPLSQEDIHEIKSRLETLQKLMKKTGFFGAYIHDPRLLFYLTGRKISCGVVYCDIDGRACLYLDGRYIEELRIAHAKVRSPYSIEHARVSCDMSFFEFMKEHVLVQLQQEGTPIRIAFDGHTIPYENALALKAWADGMNALQGTKLSFSSSDEVFCELRRQKSNREIHMIRKACDLCERGFQHIISLLKPGVSEEEISHALKLFWYEQGAESVSFDPIIAFGPHSALPHWRSSSAQLNEGDIVLIDIGVSYGEYQSDMTRTFSFGSPREPDFDRWFQSVHGALHAAEQACYIGADGADVDRAAREELGRHRLAEFFLHGLGHGVGIDVHEPPRVSQKRPSYQKPILLHDVVTLEPGVYLAGRGGVRLENSYLVTEEGPTSLMKTPLYPRWSDYRSLAVRES